MSKELRLNKAISSTGYCSRREADKLIESKRVEINGVDAVLGEKVTEEDEIKVDGRVIKASTDKPVYIAFNKPRGIVCTTDSKERKNITRFIDHKQRIFPIGRLDKDSEGLIFLTSDGDIVNKILRAGNGHEKEYIVEVDQDIDDRFIERMSNGIPIIGTVTKKCKVEKINTTTFRIILTQGLNRQIRRMCEYLGYEAISLKRVRIMNVKLDNLKLGVWRNLTALEMREINQLIKNSSKTEEASF